MLHRLLAAAGGLGGFTVTALAFSGAVVTRSTDLTVTNNDFAVVTFDTEEYDTDNYFTTSGGQGERFTIPVDGYYLFGCQGRWKADNNAVAGVRGIGVWLNGADPTTVQDIGYNEWPSSTLTGALMHQTPVGPPRFFSAADYLRVHAYQFSNNSASLDLDSSQSRVPCFWILRVG